MGAPLGNQNAAGHGAPKGNTNAKSPHYGRHFHKALISVIAESADGDLHAGLRRLASKLLKAADEGDQWALLEVFNRVDGKAPQAVTVSADEEGGSVMVARIERVIVDAKAPTADG